MEENELKQEINKKSGTLSLFGKNLTNADAVIIAEFLKNNSTVKILDLGKNNIGVEGAIAIGEALKVNNVLQALSLGDNEIGMTVQLLSGKP